METNNQNSGNGNRQNEQVDQQWINQNDQENQSQKNNETPQQEGQNKKPVYIKDMPEIKPEVNQGGI